MFATMIIIWGSNQPLRKVEPKLPLKRLREIYNIYNNIL